MSSNEYLIPKISFSAIKWKTSKLIDLTDLLVGNDGRQDLPVLTISAANGWMNQKDRFSQVIAGNELKNYTLLRKGELSYNRGNSKLAKFGVVFALKNYDEALVPKIYHSFKVNQGSDPMYLEYLFASKLPDRELGKLVSSTARMDGMLNINNHDFMSIKINHPDKIEQTQIGNFFQKMDEVIELQQKRLALTQDYKKSMLQKMFPQKGEKVPRVRFGGFSGEWGTTYFKNIAKVRRGLTYSPSDVVTNQKGVRVLRSSNIDEDTLIVSDTDVFVRESAVKIDYIKMNEILITAANGSSRLVGKHAIINRDLQNTVHGGFMLAVSTSHPEFLNSWMNGVQYKKMLQLVQGGNGAIGNLSRSMLEECKITLPCLKEQTAIGNFFQKLDEKIEAESAKLEKLQAMKKAMLQRMFV